MNEKHFKIDFEKSSGKLIIELSYFKNYIHFNTIKLLERKTNFNELLKQDIIENPDSKIVLEEIYFEENIRLSSYFYHSTIVSLFSLLENNLNEICELIIQETNFIFKLEELVERNSIKKSRNFLTKIANIDFSHMDKNWIEITTLQKIRNLIVHNNAQLKDEKITPDVLKAIKKYGNIDIHKFNKPFYLFNESLLNNFLSNIEIFINSILIQLKEMEFSKFEKAYKNEIENFFDEIPF